MTVYIATDGSGTSKGPGGWAAILRYGDSCKEISGSVAEATNNTMEITAAIMALRELKRGCTVEITTDSEYLMNGAKFGIGHWSKSGWLTVGGEPVKNRSLWEQLDKQIQRHRVTWVWVKGHSGHVDNERADVLAGEARAILLPPKTGKKKKPISIAKVSDDALTEALRIMPVAELHRLRSAMTLVSGESF